MIRILFNNMLTRRTLRKVPEVVALFWLIKLLTTALGESTSDYLVHTMSPSIAVASGLVVLGAVIGLQLTVRRYTPWIYWLAVTLVAIVGTMVADVIHIGLGIPYSASTIIFAIVLALVFWTWDRSEGTLSIHSIYTLRRELFYWAAVMSTFALGTAAGDLTANTLGIGYLGSAFLFIGLILLPAIMYWRFRLNEVIAFWAAYILTRPLGASFADWFGKPTNLGGLGYGNGVVSVVLGLLIIVLVGYLTITHTDVEEVLHPTK